MCYYGMYVIVTKMQDVHRLRMLRVLLDLPHL